MEGIRGYDLHNVCEDGAQHIYRGKMMDDTISRKAAIAELDHAAWGKEYDKALAKAMLESLPTAQPEIVRCKDCKHNPKYEWFGCPMSHLNEKQRPETAWCWKGERRTDE